VKIVLNLLEIRSLDHLGHTQFVGALE
jgi:hypothetical protein